MTISSQNRQQVRERANYLCEYCHSSEEASAARFDLDHIIPRSLDGSDKLSNLALACQRCNEYKYKFTTGVDPQTRSIIPLFNPRQQKWSEHFVWSADGIKILGITATGRATCDRLDLNDENNNQGWIQKARRFWIKGGWHPPKHDPFLSEDAE